MKSKLYLLTLLKRSPEMTLEMSVNIKSQFDKRIEAWLIYSWDTVLIYFINRINYIYKVGLTRSLGQNSDKKPKVQVRIIRCLFLHYTKIKKDKARF